MRFAAKIALSFAALVSFVSGQDLLNDEILFSSLELDVVEYVRLPDADRAILSMYSPPTDDRLFVSSLLGRIYAIEPGAVGNQPQLFFDVRLAIQQATDRRLDLTNGTHGGLRAFAFHPDFANNGKLYVSMMERRPADPSLHHYLGNSPTEVDSDSVVAEFTFDHETQRVEPESYRELFRVNMPFYDHPIKQMKFNPFAEPGDEDYGLLYIGHGDASVQSAIAGGGQNRDDALGKILRVDPLQQGGAAYTTPSNPFVGDATTLDEIYALGFRNPHNLSFAQDADGQSHLVVADIGRDNVEEINLVVSGANHGWSEREGTFVHRRGGGSINGVGPLPQDEANNGYTFPAVQFDHDAPPGQGFAGVAVAGAHVIANGSELDGQYVFGDFGNSGRIYNADFVKMLDAVTLLDPEDPDRDSPDDLTQATVSQLRINFDNDNDTTTAPLVYDTFTELLGTTRSDFRFGEGSRGELYISSKRNATVYLVTNSLPPIPGDLNGDTRVDAADIDLLNASIRSAEFREELDLNEDGFINVGDVDLLVHELLGTNYGDANLDGEVAFGDFLDFAESFGGPGGWSDGDFDGTGNVAFPDFIRLANNFGATSVSAVPEPAGRLPLCFGLMMLAAVGRRGRMRAQQG